MSDPRNPRVAAYSAPKATEVPALMAELVTWLNADDGAHPLVKAAMAHLHLVSIHPWSDGNGRMSRSLQTLLIAREGVLAPEFSSIESWLGSPGNTWEYYRELQSRGLVFQPDQDVSSWIRFNLTAYHQQAQVVQDRWTRSGRVWSLLTDFTAAAGMDERLISALHDVALTGRVRRARYEQAEGLSRQQAQRDLRDLATAGVLEPVGRTRARYYLAGDAFPELALQTASVPFTLTPAYPA